LADTTRRLLPVLVPLFAALAVAAPVLKDFETKEKKLVRLFGTPVAPNGTAVELHGDKLRLNVEAKPQTGWGTEKFFDYPRTERRVSGDFEATVQVTFTAGKEADTQMRAGLQVRFGEQGSVTYTRCIERTGRKNEQFMTMTQFLRGKPWQTKMLVSEAKMSPTVTLRLTRRGNVLTGARKDGNGKWAGEISRSADLPKEMTVGVYLLGQRAAAVAEFEDFKVTSLK